jgi:hypothetical protein
MGLKSRNLNNNNSNHNSSLNNSLNNSLNSNSLKRGDYLKLLLVHHQQVLFTSSQLFYFQTHNHQLVTPTKSVTEEENKAKSSTGKKRFLFKGSSQSAAVSPEENSKINDSHTDSKPQSTLSRVIGRKRGKGIIMSSINFYIININ